MPFFEKVIERITGQELNKIIDPKETKVIEILDKNRLRKLNNKLDPDNGFRELIPLIAINFSKIYQISITLKKIMKSSTRRIRLMT